MNMLNAEEAADLLHLNVKRVQGLARDGKLPGRAGRPQVAVPPGRARGAARSRAARAVPRALSTISARNRLRGKLARLTVDGLMAEVLMRIGDQDLVSVITRSSAERLGLKLGDDVFAVIKSTEIMIGKEGVDA